MKIRGQKGIGLLELMLSLAIIAILIVMVTRYYTTTRASEQVNEAAQEIIALYAAGQSWLQSQPAFAGDMLTKFVLDGSVPKDFADGNPWGGTIKATVGSTPTSLNMELSEVPQAACQNLKARVTEKIANAKPVCGPDPETNFTLDIDLAK